MISQNCGNRPYYNFKGKVADYCYIHRKIGMLNVTKKLCLEETCDRHAYYNYKHEKVPLYCSTHHKNGMINIKINRCIYPECDEVAYYSKPGQSKRVCCFVHRESDMHLSK